MPFYLNTNNLTYKSIPSQFASQSPRTCCGSLANSLYTGILVMKLLTLHSEFIQLGSELGMLIGGKVSGTSVRACCHLVACIISSVVSSKVTSIAGYIIATVIA